MNCYTQRCAGVQQIIPKRLYVESNSISCRHTLHLQTTHVVVMPHDSNYRISNICIVYLLPKINWNPDKVPTAERPPLRRAHESPWTRIACSTVSRCIATLDTQPQNAVTNNGAISVFRSIWFTGVAVDRQGAVLVFIRYMVRILLGSTSIV